MNPESLRPWGKHRQAAFPVSWADRGVIIRVAMLSLAVIFTASSSGSQVFAWGRNDYGQLNIPANLTNAVAVSAGYQHCLALRDDGRVIAWGQNGSGQLNVPASISNNVVAVSAGFYHNLAQINDGSLVAWGAGSTIPAITNNFDYAQSIIPSNVTNVLAFAAGGYFSMALLSDQTVAVWGNNQYGQTNVPAGLTNVVAISAGGFHCMALKLDGSIVAWGSNANGQSAIPAGLSNVVAIAATVDNSFVIKQDGSLVVWGANFFGEANLPAAVNNVVMATAGWLYSVALQDNGNPISWGYANDATLPPGITNVMKIASGFYMGLALTNNGSPAIASQPNSRWVFSGNDTALRALVAGSPPMSYQWSFNGTPIPDATNAQLVLPAIQTNQAGLYSFVASNGISSVASSNAMVTVIQQPPILTALPASLVTTRSGAATFNSAAIGSRPLSFQWQWNGTNISGATNLVLSYAHVSPAQPGNYSVSVSNQFGVAVSTNAYLTILAVADNGDSTYNTSHYSVPLSLTNAVAIAAGSFHSMALKPDNKLVVWGNNGSNQTNVPAAATNIMLIGARGSTCAIVRSNGTVLMWGDGYEFNGYSGKTNPPASATNVIAIAVGDYHCLALRKNGTVVGWGRGNEGQTNVPTSATNIMAVAVGAYHSLLLRSNGTLIAWGQNTSGQTNVPANLTNVIAIAAAFNHNYVLKADGTIYAWGDSSTSSPFNNIVAIGTGSYSGSSYYSILRADGTVTGGYVSGVSNATAIACGGNHNLVLLGDGSPCLYWPPGALPAAHPGDNLSTRVLVSGSGPIYYQWQLNGTNLPGATNATLTLTNIPITSAGIYQCVISNALGTVVSPTTTLNLTRWPLLFNATNGVTQMTTNGFKLRLTGLAGQGPLVVYASTNLLDWVPIFTNSPVVGAFDFTDASATNQPALYYRASEGP